MTTPSQQNGDGIKKTSRASMEDFKDLLFNAMSARSDFWRKMQDPRRDIDSDCGYPTGHVEPSFFQDLYDRDAISARVVQVLPRESWQVYPWVYEDEDPNISTKFEEAWNSLGQSLRGGSLFQDVEGSPIWEYLIRADEMSGIGHYGILLLGLDDGKTLDQPATFREGQKLLYLRSFPESLAQITRYNDDVTSYRFGQPEEYLVTFNDPREAQGGIGLTSASHNVHWTRVIHIADNLASSEVFGVPRMRPVLNRLLDLRKLYSGSAEMYWRGAFFGLSIESHPSLGGELTIDVSSVKDEMENYMNGLQRYMSLVGMSAKSIAPQVVSPIDQILVQIEAICIKVGIPKRVFLGSERGELASSQDDASWNDRMRSRQRSYITPRIIVPLIDCLINLGVLPRPKGYSVDWPNLDSLGDLEQANIAAVLTNSMNQYVAGGIEALMAPADYLTRILRMTEAEANAIIENAEELAEQRLEEELEARDQELVSDMEPVVDPNNPEMVIDPETNLPILPRNAPPSRPGNKPPKVTAGKTAKAPKTPKGIGGRPPSRT